MLKRVWFLSVVLIMLGSASYSAELLSLATELAGAKAGKTVKLSAGTYQGGVTIPPGVSLQGAGAGKTIINAGGKPIGLEIVGGARAIIADLTVAGATRINVSVSGTTGTLLQRLRITGSINGATFNNVSGGRMENIVSDANRYGLVMSGGSNNVIVNCTSARNSGLGISLPSGNNPVVFNNCVVETATGIYLGASLQNPNVDYNLYSALYAGKLEGQLGRKSIGEWNYLSGQDAHSFVHPVVFQNPENGEFVPVNKMLWAQDRTPVSGFGVADYCQIKAPAQDIQGSKRGKVYDLGAYVATTTPSRPADGYFEVKSGEGITSAGVFTPEGVEVCYLFHNMPLRKGRYAYWLPSRDFQYRPILAGNYQLRTVESKLSWEYRGKIGDTGLESPAGADAPLGAARLGFDGQGRLLAGNDGWAEDFIDVRGIDGASGAFLWAFRAGADTRGIVVDNDGTTYLLRRADKDARITKLNSKTGQVITWPDTSYSLVLPGGGAMNGITVLNKILYITDGNGLYLVNPQQPVMPQPIAIAGASYPSADTAGKVVWLLAQGKILALSPTGETLLSSEAVAGAISLAVSNGRMAIASGTTGKIFFFDCHDPKKLLPLGSIGRGDGPYGFILPDRFIFQNSANGPSMALADDGKLAVGYDRRIIVFDINGKSLWSSFGVFGNGSLGSYGVTPRRFDAPYSMALDLAKGSWTLEGYWNRSGYFPTADFRGEIALDKKTFAVYSVTIAKEQGVGFTLVDGVEQKPVLLIIGSGNNWVSRKDSNGDGMIDAQDAATPFNTKGMTFANPAIRPDGQLLMNNVRWQSTGLDKDNAPIFSAEKVTVWPALNTDGVSPYTGNAERFNIANVYEIDNETQGALLNLNSAPGRTGLFNGAGTDMAGFDAKGKLRWLHPLAIHKGLYNFQSLGSVFVSGVGQTSEIICVDKDGLGLGTFGQSLISHYTGYWLDHPGALQTWQAQDGSYNLLIADNYHGMHHWYKLINQNSLLRSVTPLLVSDALATQIAALPAPDPKIASERPATPVVILPRLKAPMPIDGDLVKWRTAGIIPNIIITPDTAVAGIDGPLDASAVIRMAYYDTDLYVQILRFDNNPVFFQPVSRHYMQPCVEMCINGFGPGFKFDIAKTTDAGDMIIRQRFFFTKLERLLTPEHAPRVIKILDSATEVSERAMIESVYGVDLSPDKVIVTEFKLPMDAITYEGAEADVPKMTLGSSFWLGFMVDDNNQPGADLQNLMVWPATYGTFNPPEDGAKAILGE